MKPWDPLGLMQPTLRLMSAGLGAGLDAGLGFVSRISQGSRPAAEPLALTSSSSAAHTSPASEPTLNDKVTGLLRRGVELTTAQSQAELFHRIADQLVPDEARILAKLANGDSSAVLNVHARSATGSEPVLEHASLAGRAANVALPHLTPSYLTHLLSLGLVELGPESSRLKDDYQILTADPAVMRALKEAKKGPLPPRLERLTVRLSMLGRQFWDASTAEEGR